MRGGSQVGEHIVQEAEKYLLYDNKSGETKITSLLPRNLRNMFSRKINDASRPYHSSDMFKDYDFVAHNAEIAGIQPNKGKVIYKRLLHLCPKNHRFPFFSEDPTDKVCFKVGNPSETPHFLFELGLFPTNHYRSMFITQGYNELGRYEVIVNSEGRFQLEVVDDLIPVYESNEHPIWGMNIQCPWQLILAKVWAKRCGGYSEAMKKEPMEFLKTFSNSNWKYFNLALQPKFLNNFVTKHWSQIVVKTKNSNEIKNSGLFPDEVAYKIHEIRGEEQDKQLTVVLKSTARNKWTGQMSLIDNKASLIQSQITSKSMVNLDKDIIVSGADFYNMFSSAYVTSKRPHSYSDYYILEVEPNTSDEIYLEFYFSKDGFIDYSIKQPLSNKRKPTIGSESGYKKQNENKINEDQVERYQKVRSVLIYNVQKMQAPSKMDLIQDSGLRLGDEIESRLNASRMNDDLSKSHYLEPEEAREIREIREELFNPLQYQCYQIQYNKGQSQGQANFLNIQKGWYILRIKTEESQKRTRYIFNYTTNEPIKVKEIKKDQRERDALLRQAMISLSFEVPNISLGKEEYELVASGNQFENIGYGFISIRLKKHSPYSLILEVNPDELSKGGYCVLNQFQNIKKTFGIIINRGESTSLIFEKLPGFTQYKWPPPGVQIYKEKVPEKNK